MNLSKFIQPSEKTIAILLGLGICLFPIHSKSLTFGSSTETVVFLPWIGFGLILIGLISLFDNDWKLFKENIGPKVIWIPLLIIVISGFARLIVDPSMETLAGGGLLATFFALYVAARKLGIRILWAFLPFVFVEAVSCIIQGILDQGNRAGGILTSFRDATHTANYDIATCWLVLGTALLLGFNKGIKLRFLVLVAVALYFVAAEEALFALAGLGIAAIIRKDISKKLVPILAVLAFCVIGGLFVGTTQDIYDETMNKFDAAIADTSGEYGNQFDDATTGRIGVYKEAIKDTKPLGNGYEATNFTTHTVHNTPLIIYDQIGPIAALAWLWIALYCFWKTSWKYVWIAVLTLSVWDHYIWTQAGPWFWVIVGLSLTIPIQDKVFIRRDNETIKKTEEGRNNPIPERSWVG